MNQSFSALIKPASSACNMRCRYCFYADVAKNRAAESYGMMSTETLELIVKKAFEHADSEVAFAFQGGEPTLAGLPFYHALIRFEKQYNRRHIPVKNSIQTNGLLLNDEWAAFLHANDFLVGLSMDGCGAMHDAARVDASDKGTFARVCDAAALLNKHKVDFNILCVVTGPVARGGAKAYKYLRNHHFPYLQFIPCLDPLGGESSPYSLSAHDYAHFLRETFSAYYDDFMCGHYVSVRLFDNYVQMLAGRPPESCGMSGQCACCLTIEGDGSAFPCDFYVLDEWKLGNIRTDSIDVLLAGESAARFIDASRPVPEKCAACRWYPLCRGGCRRNREPVLEGNPGQNVYCEAYSAFFEFAYERLERMARITAR